MIYDVFYVNPLPRSWEITGFYGDLASRRQVPTEELASEVGWNFVKAGGATGKQKLTCN